MPPPAPPQSCLALLREMVRHDTVTPRTSGRIDAEAQLGEYLAGLATRWGLQVSSLPAPEAAPNVLLTHQADPARPWLLLDSHLDTVGVERMTVDPFAAEVRDGRVYGRGACDTKGTGAAMLWALKETAAAGDAAANLALLFTVGEEARQVGARAFLEKDLQALPWRPSAVIVGEPTLMQVVRATNGYVRFNLATIGHATHSSAPEKGRNAISDMARAIVAIEEQYVARLNASHPLTGRSTCSINVVHGGVEHNVVPERCTATIDHRLAPGQEAETALSSVRGVLDRLAAERTGFQYRLEDSEAAPPLCPDGNGAIADWAACALDLAGIPTAVRGAPYTTNANHYAAHGLPALVLGPGDIAQAHTADEWIALEQLELGVKGYRALMLRPPPGQRSD